MLVRHTLVFIDPIVAYMGERGLDPLGLPVVNKITFLVIMLLAVGRVVRPTLHLQIPVVMNERGLDSACAKGSELEPCGKPQSTKPSLFWHEGLQLLPGSKFHLSILQSHQKL